MKAPLVEGSSMYQVGGQAGHRPEELLFAFKSVLAWYSATKKVVVGQCHDVAKFFDKEVAADTLDVMYRRQVDPKICRLWAKLNDTRIQVRTGVGTSDKAKIGIVIGQGTMGGAPCLPGQPGRWDIRAVPRQPGGAAVWVSGSDSFYLPR